MISRTDSLVLGAMLALGSMLAIPSIASACAGCRNPNLPMGRSDAGPVEPGQAHLTLSTTGTTVHVSHPAGCVDESDCDAIPIQPAHTHDLSMFPIELRASLSVGLNEHWATQLTLPLRLVHTTAEYHTPDGQPFVPLDEGVHHREETLFGLGDGRLGARYVGRAGNWTLVPSFGFTLPLGVTHEDPYALGDEGIAHQHVQFGSGTFNPYVGFDAVRGFRRTEWSLYGSVERAIYQNRHGYMSPFRGYGGFSAGWKASGTLLLALGIEGTFEGAERWDGQVYTEELQGRYEMLIVPRMSWTVGATTLGADLRFVAYRVLIEGGETGDVRSPVVFTVSGSWAL